MTRIALGRIARPASYNSVWWAVRSSTALPCPTSAANSSNAPGGGRGFCHSKAGNKASAPHSRQAHGQGRQHSAAPAVASAAKGQGGMANRQLANGQVASHARPAINGSSSAAATCQAVGQSTPSKAKGVTRALTQGMATRLASMPTQDSCPKNNKPKGASAKEMSHCSRHKPHARTSKARTAPVGCAFARTTPVPVSINTPTATKLSQKPACNMAQGSSTKTTTPAAAHTSAAGQWRACQRKSVTTPSIQTVRCAGTPQPLNSA